MSDGVLPPRQSVGDTPMAPAAAPLGVPLPFPIASGAVACGETDSGMGAGTFSVKLNVLGLSLDAPESSGFVFFGSSSFSSSDPPELSEASVSPSSSPDSLRATA